MLSLAGVIIVTIKSPAQLSCELEYFAGVFFVLDLFSETLYSFIICKVHGREPRRALLLGHFEQGTIRLSIGAFPISSALALEELNHSSSKAAD